MDIGVQTNTREAFIALGQVVARSMQRVARQQPWSIALQGDFNSGKELFALAVDEVFNPHRYPQGITKDLSAEKHLAGGNDGQPQVVFENFRGRYAPDRLFFDRYLDDFQRQNPTAHVLIASNISRPDRWDAYRGAENLDSERLDINLTVYKIGVPFTRGVDLTMKDPQVLARVIADYKTQVEPYGSRLVAAPSRLPVKQDASSGFGGGLLPAM